MITDLTEQLESISPVYHVTSDDPPLLLIHGDKDLTVPLQQSEILKEKYEEAGLTVKLIVQPGGGHTYWDGIEKQYTDVAKWFDAYLD
jgi:dipeptidyl aminopeptidase/acylaminoacyl peptidase